MSKTDDLEWRLEYAMQVYSATLDDMHRLKDRLNYILGLFVTPTVGAVTFLYTSYDGPFFALGSVVFFWLPLAVSVALLATCLIKLFLLLRQPYEYSRPPPPSKLSAFYNDLQDEDIALFRLKEKLLSAYEAAIDHNAKLNADRTRVMVNVQQLVSTSFPFIMVAALVAFGHSLTSKQKNFVPFEEAVQMIGTEGQDQPTSPPPETSEAPSSAPEPTPAEPTFPPNEMFLDHVEPPSAESHHVITDSDGDG